VDRPGFDYHLREGAAAVGTGTDPGSLNGFSLSPAAQYVHRAAEEPRPLLGPIDIGAYGRLGADRQSRV